MTGNDMVIAALGFGITGVILAAIALWFAFMAHERLDRADPPPTVGGMED